MHGELVVRCDTCHHFFEDFGVELGSGPEVAGDVLREGREAVMPDGRPIRSIERIVQDA